MEFLGKSESEPARSLWWFLQIKVDCVCPQMFACFLTFFPGSSSNSSSSTSMLCVKTNRKSNKLLVKAGIRLALALMLCI